MISTFVSYKGGVGRTRTLVHTGLRLAAQVRELGLRVLLVDMDLDAPGFEPYFPEAELAAAAGVSALLTEYSTVPRADRSGWLRDQLAPPAPDPRSRLIFTFEEASNLAVLPAGKASLVEGGYHRILETVLPELRRRSGKLPATEGLFGDFRAALAAHWDYVLIDARAGHAALTFASAIVLADVLVACFRLNQANLDGIRDVFGTFLAGGAAREMQERRFHVIPVATPVPQHSGKDVVEWIGKAAGIFYPETRNVDEDDDGDQAEPFDPLQGMLPSIHRIYEDAAARLGEWRFLQPDGKPAEGMDREMPSYVAVEKLASHFRVLNADHDVGGARAVELYLYNEVGEKKKALTYWEKRARLQPLAAGIWDDFTKGYAAPDDQGLRVAARETLGTLIEHWRERLAAGSLDSGTSVLANALQKYCRSFGKGRADGGLALVDEAIELAPEDPLLSCDVEFLAGQVVMELVDERDRSEELFDRHERPVNLELALHHFAVAARHASALGSQGEQPFDLALYENLADALAKANRATEAIRVLDHRLANLLTFDTPASKERIGEVLHRQAELLLHAGHHDWAVRNLQTAPKHKIDSQIIRDLQEFARWCDLHELAREAFEQVLDLFPGQAAANAYGLEAIRLILGNEIPRAHELIDMSRELRRGGLWFHLTKGAAHLMAGEYQEAAAAFEEAASISSDFYQQALALVASALGGGPAPASSSFLAGNLDESFGLRTLAAFAHDDVEALRVLNQREIDPNQSPRDRALDLWPRAMDRAVRGLPGAHEVLATVEELYTAYPLLAVVHRNDFELRVAELVWNHRRTGGEAELITPIDELLERIHRVEAPPAESFTPRDVSQPLPRLAFVPDTWEP